MATQDDAVSAAFFFFSEVRHIVRLLFLQWRWRRSRRQPMAAILTGFFFGGGGFEGSFGLWLVFFYSFMFLKILRGLFEMIQ